MDYKQKKKKVRRKAHTVGILLFAAVILFFAVLGWILPLRPSVSQREKRELTKFPKFSISALMDGSYFSQISTWYSDTFPFRDAWVLADSGLESLRGIRTVQIIQGDTAKDEIPDAPMSGNSGGAQTETAPAEEESAEPVSLEAETENSGEVTEVSRTTAAAADSGSSTAVTTSASVSPAEPGTTAASSDASSDLPMVQGQVQNNLIISGDTAYGIYYFNLNAANTYIETVNRMAEELKGQTNVYCMLVPISSTLYVSRDTLDAAESSDEAKAMSYYYDSMNTDVKKVPILDTLMDHRDEYIYFRTDHHWNGRGAYYAACELLKAMGQTPHDLSEYQEMDFGGFLGSYYQSSLNVGLRANPDVINAFVPITCNTMTFTETDGTTLDWPIINDVSGYSEGQKYSTFAAGDNPYSVIHNPNVTNGRSAVVIKESYGNAVIPFLTDYYQDLYWFDYRYYNGSITQFIEENGIDDLIFINATEPISSIEQVQRMSGLLP